MSLRRLTARAVSVLLSCLLIVPVVARGAEDEEPRKGGPKELAGLEYRLVGPPAGGRVCRVAGVAGDPRTYYAATASGGIWKSSDGGARWKPVADDLTTSTFGAIAVAPSDPNVVYAGSGEANIRGNVVEGDGLYKSTDAGKTWRRVMLLRGQVGTVVVDPRSADVAFAAVLGKPFGPGEARGVYRTRDGGRTWEKVLYVDADTGASDVALDPSNPRVVFAGTWQARRRPWELVSGGPGSGLHVSRDGGETWARLAGRGLPAGIWGRVGVAVAPSDPRRVYALVEAEKGGLFRSDDGGETWSLASGHRALRQRAWYYSTLTVDPRNAEVVWFPQVPLLRTIDGGKTIRQVKGTHHGDHHDAWIDPADPRRIAVANDGGVDVSTDGGATWSAAALPISQFYHVAADNRVPYRVMGAMQDLGTASGPSNSLASNGITLGDWHVVGGGEAGHVVPDPREPDVVYAGEYLGILTRYDHRTRQARNVGPWPENTSGAGAAESRWRFQWTAPIATSPHEPGAVYYGGNVLFRTSDGGQTWAVLSPDLTRNDPQKQRWSGGPITGDNTGAEYYDTIFAIAESPVENGLLWVGSDDGLVHVSRDGGKTWTNVTANVPGLPEWGTVSVVEPSPFDAGSAYLVVDAHRMDDLRPHLWKTSAYGKTWKRLSAGLAQDVYLHVVREDPRKKGMLYAGTDRGVVFSRDDGATWADLRLNLPTVPVHDLVVKGDDLVVGTHGRSIWILDDLGPVRELTPAVASEPFRLLPSTAATRWSYSSPISGHVKGPGVNPRPGALVSYWLRDEPKGDVTLEILDARGALVRRLSSAKVDPEMPEDDPDAEKEPPKPLPKGKGVRRAAWDLRYEGAPRIRGAKIDAGDPDEGPLVPPGTYTAKLTVDGQSQTTAIEVRADPRSTATAVEREAQLALALQLRDDIGRLTTAVNEVRSVREQLLARTRALEGRAAATLLVESARSLAARCDSVEEQLHNPRAQVAYDILAMPGGAKLYSRLIPLYNAVGEGEAAPTQAMKELAAHLRRQLDVRLAEWKAIVERDVPAVNARARELAPEFVVVPGR